MGVSDTADTKLNTTHQNQISSIQIQIGDKISKKFFQDQNTSNTVSAIKNDNFESEDNAGKSESRDNQIKTTHEKRNKCLLNANF